VGSWPSVGAAGVLVGWEADADASLKRLFFVLCSSAPFSGEVNSDGRGRLEDAIGLLATVSPLAGVGTA